MIKELDYSQIAKEIIESEKFGVADIIRAYHEVSPIKGVSFYYDFAIAANLIDTNTEKQKVTKSLIVIFCTGEVDKIENKPKIELSNRRREFRKQMIAVVIGGAVGSIAPLYQTAKQKETVLNPIVLPKIQIVRETIYIKNQPDQTALHKTSVQIVKSQHPKKDKK